jgi:nucleotide-binding universal stress UspA family protein
MKILVPVDGSRYSDKALEIAADYAKMKNAEINLISVVPIIETLDIEVSAARRDDIKKTFENNAERVVKKACGILSAEDIIAHCKTIVASHSVPDAIVDYAKEEGVDLIIIGSRGLGPSSRFKLGSVASKVVKHSPCSVHVVKIAE